MINDHGRQLIYDEIRRHEKYVAEARAEVADLEKRLAARYADINVGQEQLRFLRQNLDSGSDS